MTTPTDDRRDLLTVIAYMKAAPGKEEELRVELEGPDRADQPGGRLRQLRPPPERGGPGAFFFYENWESAEQLDAHLATAHLVRFADIMGDLLDENGLTLSRLRRIA